MEEIIQESYDTSLYGVMAGKWGGHQNFTP